MKTSVINTFEKLNAYCEQENYKGWDPYDGLNSKIFQATPFKHWALARLAWIQLFKRNPVNLRKLFLVPKGHNPKALGLFLTGYCNLYGLAKQGFKQFGSPEEIRGKIQYLAGLLTDLQTSGYSGACWGYNFDWQSKAFFLPKKTPTVVVTSFVVNGLLDAYECTNDERYLNTALSSADFVINDLNRIHKPNDLFMFSYSPLDKRAVYNATLLGTRILSRIYTYTKSVEQKQAAYISAKAVCLTQNDSGAFPHSDQIGDSWRDNFHTGFKLESLADYVKYCQDNSLEPYLDKGFRYWKENFFLRDGTAKYYDDKVYPVDLHCAAQAIVTIIKSGKLQENHFLTEKILNKAIHDMFDEEGFFHFQKTKYYINKIPYMRWPNAWMFYSISYWMLNNVSYGKN